MADTLVVADTDLVIDFLRDRSPGADWVERHLRAALLRVAAITAFELRLGADFLARRRSIELLLAHRTLPLDALGALLAGGLFQELRTQGQGIDVRDALIAGTCRRFALPLATRNTRHFDRVAGLRLVELDPLG